MAILKGEYGDGTPCAFEITPITPAIDGERDAYNVTFYEEEAVIIRRMYNVHDWIDMGHYWMFRIAYTFQKASHIVTDQLGFCLSSFPATPKEFEYITLSASIDWLQVIMEARKTSENYEKPSKISLHLFMQTNFDLVCKDPNLQYEFARFQFCCSVEAAEDFGCSLESECEATRELRVRLGIPAPDDYDECEYEEGDTSNPEL